MITMTSDNKEQCVPMNQSTFPVDELSGNSSNHHSYDMDFNSIVARSVVSQNIIKRFEDNQYDQINLSEKNNCLSDTPANFYTEIYNYVNSKIYPEGVTESYKKMLKKRSHHYRIIDGTLFYGTKQLRKVITDKKQQLKILEDSHVELPSGIHLGVKKMHAAISSYFFWRKLYVDVSTFVRQCNKCSESNEIEQQCCLDEVNQNEICNEENTSKTWAEVEVKLYGPFPKTDRQNEYLVTMIDPSSHWIMAQPVPQNPHPKNIASFIFDIFCLFGFTKCHIVGLSMQDIETVRESYKAHLQNIQTILRLLGETCETTICSSYLMFSEELENCRWASELFETFVETHPDSWDIDIKKFLFQFHVTSTVGNSSSPYFAMFGRKPVFCLEHEKENVNNENNELACGKLQLSRRKLQSSIVQCRHCKETFTSKISFRIHQRKHTEDAQARGILDGQDVSGVKERKYPRLAVLKRKQRLGRQKYLTNSTNRLLTHMNERKLQGETFVRSRQEEVRASAVEAVKRVLASANATRCSRGKYQKYPSNIREEMAKYAMEHGNLSAVRYFSQKLGSKVSESTIRNIVKLYNFFSPELKDEIGKFAATYGVEAASCHFTEKLGKQVTEGLVHRFKKLYLNQYPCNDKKELDGDKRNIVSSNIKTKITLTAEQKEEIGLYACHHSIPSTVEHFNKILQFQLRGSTVCKFRKLYIDKHQSAQIVETSVPLLHTETSTVCESSCSQTNTHTIDVLQSSLNLLNNPQLNSTSLLYEPYQNSLSQSHLVSLSQQQTQTSPVINSLTPCSSSNDLQGCLSSYPQEHHSVNSSVVMPQNLTTISTFHEAQTFTQYSQENEIMQQEPTNIHHNSPVQLPMHSPPSGLSHPSLSAIPVSISPSQDQAHFSTSESSAPIIPSHNDSVISEDHSPFIESHSGTTNFVHQLITNQEHYHIQSPDLQQPLHIPNSSNNNSFAIPSHNIHQSNMNSNSFAQSFDNSNSSLGFHSNSVVPGISATFQPMQNTSHISRQDATLHNSPEKSPPQPKGNIVSNALIDTKTADNSEGKALYHNVSTKEIEDDNCKILSECNVEETPILSAVSSLKSLIKKCNVKKTNSNAFLKKECNSKKQRKNKGQKRGNYTSYSPEIRAEIGKYAAEHGSLRACAHFKETLGYDIPESTVRGLRDKYLVKKEQCAINNCGDAVTSIGYAQRGRPMRLGMYEKEVKECIQELVKSGERVSAFLAITTAKQVLMQYDPMLLEENGGSIRLNATWAKSFLKRMGVHNS